MIGINKYKWETEEEYLKRPQIHINVCTDVKEVDADLWTAQLFTKSDEAEDGY